MLNIDLTFFSKLASPSTRRLAATELASIYAAEDLLIFDYDEDVGEFLPSAGFVKTIKGGRTWKNAIAICNDTGEAHAALMLRPTNRQLEVTADVTFKKIADHLVFALINAKMPNAQHPQLPALLNNLNIILKNERKSQRFEAQNLTLRELASDLEAYSEILSRTRMDLHDALLEARTQKGDLHDFVTQVPAPMVVFLGPEHRFHIANPAYEELVQRPVIGRTLREVFTVEEVGYYIPILDRVYNTGEPFIGRDLPINLKGSDGQIKNMIINVSYSPFKKPDGSIKGILVFVEDVTAQFMAKQKAEDLTIEAQKANQAKSQFLANMSHEIRTPMNAILGFADLMRDPMIRKDDHDEFLRRIRANGDHLLALIDDVLDLSRVESGKMVFDKTKFSIIEMVNEIYSSFNVLARGKAIQTRLQFRNAIPNQIKSDPTRVKQIIINLMSNAIKFTDSGKVDLTVEFQDTETPSILIEVEDTGIGIPEPVQAELFKPFRQADDTITRRFGGTGLGLALSRRISEALGGKLLLTRSQVGIGSTFSLVLPVGDVDFMTTSRTSVNLKEENSFEPFLDVLTGKKVLLAEDSADNRAVMRAFLRNTKVVITFAEDGEEAVQKALGSDFDIILMDIQMPKMDGLKATRELRERGFEKPIVALTAHALPEEKKRSFDAGCDGHLTKPISRETLIRSLVGYLSKK